jgi:tetratricopeptide (TPR) repeat protein
MPRPSRQRGPRTSADRFLFGGVAAIAALMAVVHAVSARPQFSWMWGAHFYRFYPIWLLVVATLALAAVVLAALIRRDAVAAAVTNAFAPFVEGRRIYVSAAVCLVAGTALFWFARITHTSLGDGNVIVEEIGTSHLLLEREPLASLLQYAVYGTTGPWFQDANRSPDLNAQDALAVGSVLAGFFFLVVAAFLARELARLVKVEDDRHARVIAVLLSLVVITQGYVQLFFGYVENYSFYIVGVLAYLWLALAYLRGASPLLGPALALILCIALHLSSLVLAASFAMLIVFALARRGTRPAALRDLSIAAAVGLVVVLVFSRLRPGYNMLATIVTMIRTAFADKANAGYMFSTEHYRDFFNEQLLVGPLGMFLFLPACIATLLVPKLRRQPAAWFFLLAGLGYLAACWLVVDSNLGYARDWDLFSQAGLVFTIAALALLLLLGLRRTVLVAALVCALATSIYHTVPWIGVNANEARSLARLQTLPLGLGRTEVVVSNYYRQRGDFENQRLWLKRALQANPNNVNAVYLLGVLDLQSGRYQDAIPSLEQAVRMLPNKLDFRMNLVMALNATNRMPEAIPHLEMLTRAEPDNLSTQVALGEALEMAGRDAEARSAFERAERLCSSIVEKHPDNARVNSTYGFVLLRLGRPDEAEPRLMKAIAADPQSDAQCFLGYVLRDLRRVPEARERFQSCLASHPEFSGRTEIEDWLRRNPP